jgi:hypothetical protein
MSTITTTTPTIADDVLAPPADIARASDERERRLTDYIRAHTGADVAVRLSPAVDTAFIAPTSEEALLETENADVSNAESKRLVSQIEADYLIVISTHPATLDRLPLTDQLTADRAQQFGFALHELGHIRYTAMAQVGTLLEQTIDEAHHDFVHELWNTCEDAAIEHQLAVDQSQIAADRLALTRQSLSRPADEVPDDAHRQYTFADAVDTALYDQGVYDTGTLDALCDPADPRFTFHSTADQQAYELVADDLRQLLAAVLSTPDSLERTERIIECWHTVLQPLIDPAHESHSAPDSTPPTGDDASSDTTTSDGVAQGETTTTTETSSGEESSTTDTDPTEEPADTPSRPPPSEITTERTHGTSHSDALEYPSLGEAEPADVLTPADQSATDTDPTTHSSQQAAADERSISTDGTGHDESPPATPADSSTTDSSPQQPSSSHRTDPSDERTTDATAAGPGDDRSPSPHSQGPSPRSDQADTATPDDPETSASSSSQQPRRASQTTLDEFYETDPPAEPDDPTLHRASETDETERSNDTEKRRGDSQTASTDDTATSGTSDSTATETVSASETNETTSDGADATDSSGDDGRHPTTEDSTEQTDDKQPTPAESLPTPVHTADQLERDAALTADQHAAHSEADRATPDSAALAHDLADVAEALEQLPDGTGATPDSLDELELMPPCEDRTDPHRWQVATASAAFVGETLRTALRESRRDAYQAGVTSGVFDRQRAGALARGDVNTFRVRQPGDEKAYDLVLVLDRSSSMSASIVTAEDALLRFALACEDIGINVAVIDFVHSTARLAKPFSVDCDYVRSSLLPGETGGGTPLADALGFARELLKQRANHPLILIVTDGKPGDSETYHDELAACYAPVCGLTLVLDRPAGHIPSTVADNEQFYDRHVYVHDPKQLDERLDQFAVIYDGL